MTMNQRGYNLVEVAIILAVLGLLIGATLVPVGRLDTSNAYRSEEAAMQAQQDAILGYAMKNRTQQWEVVVLYDDNTATHTLSQTVFLPAGRPYLPCPDVDGDGYEDRVGDLASDQGHFPLGDAGLRQYEVPLGRNRFILHRGLTLTTTAASTAENPMLRQGNCVVTRGILPWKTLGVPETDSWGNRYTYQVDDILSNALVGFNQDSIIDSFDPRKPITLNTATGQWEYDRRDVMTTLGIVRGEGSSAITLSYTNNRMPLLICDSELTAQCLSRNTVQAMALAAGKRTTVAYEGSRRQYQAGDVVEGAAYAIISHGENGHGAVARDRSALRTMRCRPPVLDSDRVVTGARSLGDAYETEIINFPFAPNVLPNNQRYCRAVETESGGHPVDGNFIMAGPHRHKRSEVFFDDVVVWGMREDLSRLLSAAQVLPAPDLPIFRSYEL